jgi:hypothetical protein
MIGYELYLQNGPTWPVGGSDLRHHLGMGWMVGGGGRSLFFNTNHDAAWVIDLGVSYQYNRGDQDDAAGLFVRQPPVTVGGVTSAQPDKLLPMVIHDLDRTNFNYALGRDWWLWGPGATGLSNGWNLRVGAMIGGRWGTAHVDLVSKTVPGVFSRRQNATTGVFVASHMTFEIPMGTTIFFTGLEFQWGYDWTNLIPPLTGDMASYNLLMTAGIRF